MNCKRVDQIVVGSLVCLTIPSSLLTKEAVAQSQHAGHRVQADLAGLVADAVAQGLTAQGYDVYRDRNRLTVATRAGELGLDFPTTQEALERGEITVSIDGLVVHRDSLSQLSATDVIDLQSCILAGVDMAENCFDICDFSSGPDALCKVGCSFGLATSTLQCILD